MGIDFFSGEITGEQIRLPDDMRYVLVESLAVGETCLIDGAGIWMDPTGLVWLDGKTTQLAPEQLVGEMDSPIRVIRLPEGFVVDISSARQEFTDETDDRVKFAPSEHPPYVYEGDSYTRVPVIALVTNEVEASMLAGILKDRYDITYGDAETTTRPD